MGQQSFPEFRGVPEIVDEFIDLLELANKAKVSEIRERIPEQAYFRNFLGLARRIAPDGQRIRQVGFTVIRGSSQRSVGITRCAEEFGPLRREESPPIESQTVTVQGVLRYADATGKGSDQIKVIDEKQEQHLVRVPEGMMNDIVRPMWDSIVKITGTVQNNYIMLDDIQEVVEGEQ